MSGKREGNRIRMKLMLGQLGQSRGPGGLARRLSSITVLVALVCITASCGDDPISPSPYEGNWVLALVGPTSGTTTIEVRSQVDGGLRFSSSIDMTGNPSGGFLLQGTVDDAGTLSGTFSCLLVVGCGSLDGSLSANPGTGTFSVTILTRVDGTWTAVKQ
jgi:hypothetical protein